MVSVDILAHGEHHCHPVRSTGYGQPLPYANIFRHIRFTVCSVGCQDKRLRKVDSKTEHSVRTANRLSCFEVQNSVPSSVRRKSKVSMQRQHGLVEMRERCPPARIEMSDR